MNFSYLKLSYLEFGVDSRSGLVLQVLDRVQKIFSPSKVLVFCNFYKIDNRLGKTWRGYGFCLWRFEVGVWFV